MTTDKRTRNHDRLVAAVASEAKSLGYKVAQLRPAGMDARGWPDLSLAHSQAGVVVHLECKTGAGRLTASQSEWISTLTSAGNAAWVVRWNNLEDTKTRLSSYAATDPQLTLICTQP